MEHEAIPMIQRRIRIREDPQRLNFTSRTSVEKTGNQPDHAVRGHSLSSPATASKKGGMKGTAPQGDIEHLM